MRENTDAHHPIVILAIRGGIEYFCNLLNAISNALYNHLDAISNIIYNPLLLRVDAEEAEGEIELHYKKM